MPGLDTPQPLYQAGQNYNFSASGAPRSTQSAIGSPSRAGNGILKLLLLILIPLALTVGVGVFVITRNQEQSYQQSRNVVLAVPMRSVNWQDLGNVFEPIINLPIKTQAGFEEWEFLLDSGAVVSSLPREWADKMGKDMAFMQRSVFRGFGGKTSFAYQGDMMVLLGEKEVSIPVVFTEAVGTKSLLGRKGFFEAYSVYFNHIEKRIEIRE